MRSSTAGLTINCNSLLYGVADQQLKRLQSVQNADARLVTGTRRSDHIIPMLKVLHWLPVRQRIQYNQSINQSINQSLITKGPDGHLQCYIDNR